MFSSDNLIPFSSGNVGVVKLRFILWFDVDIFFLPKVFCDRTCKILSVLEKCNMHIHDLPLDAWALILENFSQLDRIAVFNALWSPFLFGCSKRLDAFWLVVEYMQDLRRPKVCAITKYMSFQYESVDDSENWEMGCLVSRVNFYCIAGQFQYLF